MTMDTLQLQWISSQGENRCLPIGFIAVFRTTPSGLNGGFAH